MKKLAKTLCIAGGVLCAVKGLDNRLETTYYDIKSAKIPKEFDGFRIVQISDFHCDRLPDLIDEVRNEAPDLIVCTGDMVNDHGPYAPAVRLLERLCAIAPVYMITGNHDVWRSDSREIERAFRRTGAKMLHNERVFLRRGNGKIALTGIDDPFTRDSTLITQVIRDALKKVPPYEGFDILLFHRANLLDHVKTQGFELILSGHMHGGQVRLPGFGGILSPKSSFASNSNLLFPKYFGGHYQYEGATMIVNRGLGNPMIIPRVFNRPELVVVHLKSKK